MPLFQVFKGALFRTATEHKEQTRYFSKRVLSVIRFLLLFSLSYWIIYNMAILCVHSGYSRAFQSA
jgi:hypothetical protein